MKKNLLLAAFALSLLYGLRTGNNEIATAGMIASILLLIRLPR